MSFGGSAYTLHINQNIPLEEAYKIENSFKELHSGMYAWGENNFTRAVEKGYIESADGWKLKLPKFDLFKEYELEIKKITKEQWQMYKQGKIEYKKINEALEKKEKYITEFPNSLKFYKSKKNEVSQFFKLKSEYQRLCLNNPIQSSAAHMTKYATLLLFDWIVKNNYINIIKIVNVVHDELIVECPVELIKITKEIVEKSMTNAGNKYLTDLKIKAESNSGESWYEAK